MLSVRGKTPTLRLLLKNVSILFCKIYVILGVKLKMKYHATKKSKFGPLKLDESRYTMKGIK